MLTRGEKVQPEHFDCVTIFFSDIVGFTDMSSELEAAEVMDMLDRLYGKFDTLCKGHNLFKVSHGCFELEKCILMCVGF